MTTIQRNFSMTTPAQTPAADTVPISVERHEQDVVSMVSKCQQLEFRTSWFSRSKMASGQLAEKMAQVAQASSKSLTVRKRLLSSSHPAIKALNAARAALFSWRDSFAIVKSGGVKQDGDDLQVSAGVRLILTDQIEEFEAGFRQRRDELMSAARAASSYLHRSFYDGEKTWPPILDMEREALGESFDLKDYPEDLSAEIVVTDPCYATYAPSMLLPPSVLARERERIHAELNSTLELVVTRLAEQLDETFSSIASLLVQPQSINPRAESNWAQYKGAEIIDRIDRDGETILTIKHQETETKSVTLKLPAMPTEFVERDLRPEANQKKRAVRLAAFDNFMEQLESFNRVKAMLGAHGQALDVVMKRLKDCMVRSNDTSSSIAKRVKTSAGFRANLNAALNDARNALADRVTEVQALRRRTFQLAPGADE